MKRLIVFLFLACTIAAIMLGLHGPTVAEPIAGSRIIMTDDGEPLIWPCRGQVFFVSSVTGAATASGKSPILPLTTLNLAVAKCTANRGDTIYLLPKHAETISTAALSPALSVAGIKVIGLGEGEQRPTFTLTHVDAEVDVSAADVSLKSILIKTGVDSQKIMLDINSTDCRVEACEFREGSALQSLVAIDITGAGANACDRAKIINCRIVQTADGPNGGIELGEVADEVEIAHCFIDGDYANAGIHNPTGKTLTNLLLKDNIVANRDSGEHAIELVSACTGFAVGNMLYGDTLGTILDPGSLKCLGNMEADAIDQAGVATPATTAGPLPANAIGATTFAAGAIDATAVANDTVDATAIATAAIDADAIATDAVGAAELAADAVAEIAASTSTQIGTAFWVKKTLVSSAVVQAGVDITGVSATGELAVLDVIVKTNATGLAAGTNFEVCSNNANGLLNIFVETVANLGATKTMDLTGASVTKIRTVLEVGKKLIAKATVADCTGAGTIDVYVRFERLTAGATIAAAP